MHGNDEALKVNTPPQKKKKMRQCQSAQAALFVVVGVHKSQEKKRLVLFLEPQLGYTGLYILYI